MKRRKSQNEDRNLAERLQAGLKSLAIWLQELWAGLAKTLKGYRTKVNLTVFGSILLSVAILVAAFVVCDFFILKQLHEPAYQPSPVWLNSTLQMVESQFDRLEKSFQNLSSRQVMFLNAHLKSLSSSRLSCLRFKAQCGSLKYQYDDCDVSSKASGTRWKIYQKGLVGRVVNNGSCQFQEGFKLSMQRIAIIYKTEDVGLYGNVVVVTEDGADSTRIKLLSKEAKADFSTVVQDKGLPLLLSWSFYQQFGLGLLFVKAKLDNFAARMYVVVLGFCLLVALLYLATQTGRVMHNYMHTLVVQSNYLDQFTCKSFRKEASKPQLFTQREESEAEVIVKSFKNLIKKRSSIDIPELSVPRMKRDEHHEVVKNVLAILDKAQWRLHN